MITSISSCSLLVTAAVTCHDFLFLPNQSCCFSETGWQKFHGPIHNPQDLGCQQIVNYVTFCTILDVGFPFVSFGKSGVNLVSYFLLLVVTALIRPLRSLSSLPSLKWQLINFFKPNDWLYGCLFFDWNLALFHYDHYPAWDIVTLVDSHQAACFLWLFPIAESASSFFHPLRSFLIDLCRKHGPLTTFCWHVSGSLLQQTNILPWFKVNPDSGIWEIFACGIQNMYKANTVVLTYFDSFNSVWYAVPQLINPYVRYEYMRV